MASYEAVKLISIHLILSYYHPILSLSADNVSIDLHITTNSFLKEFHHEKTS